MVRSSRRPAAVGPMRIEARGSTRLWPRYGGWIISAGGHAVLLAVLAMLVVPSRRGESPWEIDSQFTGTDASPEFATGFELAAIGRGLSDESLAWAAGPVASVDEMAMPSPSSLVPSYPGPSVQFPDADGLGSRWGDGGAGGGGFFGITASGNRFVYIVDASGSMHGRRFRRARAELERSLSGLRPKQEFFVLFYNHLAYPMPMPGLVKANRRNLRTVRRWIDEIHPAGNTNPWPALEIALNLDPDAIYLLSDGLFETDVIGLVQKTNTTETVIHTIGFEERAGELVLQLIAAQNGGQYRFVR